jgi:hypothetical protein
LLREENRNLKEENARLKSVLAAQPKPAPQQVSPKIVAPAPVAQVYYLPMWARITPFLLLAALAANAVLFGLWRSQKKKFKEMVSRRAERAEDNRHYDSVAATENERLQSEIADLGRELSEGSIEGILADREQLRRDRGLPEEERGEVLHAVLGYFFGDLAKDRKPALRALVRFYFPQGLGLHRQNDTAVEIPCSGGRFTFKGGAVNVSFYAQPSGPSGQEVNFDNLHQAIENSSELRESLGIPSSLVTATEEDVPQSEVVVETVSTTPESLADRRAAYERTIGQRREELRQMREETPDVPGPHSPISVLS